MSEVQFWVAYDGASQGRVTINEAKRGKQYECLECKGVMIPKKGDINRHHFAHKADFSCSGEGQRHLYIKETMYAFLQNNLERLYPLTNKSLSVEMEKKFKGHIPDVILKWFHAKEMHYLAIEVCDTSPCTEEKIATYGKNNICEIKISDWKEEEMNNPFFIATELYDSVYQRLMKTHHKNVLKRISEKEKELKDARSKLRDARSKLSEVRQQVKRAEEILEEELSQKYLDFFIGKWRKYRDNEFYAYLPSGFKVGDIGILKNKNNDYFALVVLTEVVDTDWKFNYSWFKYSTIKTKRDANYVKGEWL